MSDDRHVTVARSYIHGLEDVRGRYQRIQSDHMRLTQEALTLAAHTIILHKLLAAVMREMSEEEIVQTMGDTFEIVASEVLDNAQAALTEIYSCPCGHSKFDHDANGCNYLQCRKVCVLD